MSLNIKKLKVSLPANPFGQAIKDFTHLSNQLEVLSKSAGIENNNFRVAYGEVCKALASKERVEDVLYSSIHVRALALSLHTDAKKNVSLTRRLLNKITEIVKKPSSLVIESFYQHFLSEYDRLADLEATADWLLEAKRLRGNDEQFDANILSANGPKWLAERAIKNSVDFDHLIADMKLERYANGRYLTVAKGIYYIEQLNTIPLGQEHPILEEVQKPSVFDSQYDSESLLGHQILRSLIGRSIGSHISESWMNVVLAIGGDPRVPSSNPRYIKWWKGLEPNLIQAVRGWLSKLDLKLFLEALEDYSYSSSNYELQRMYPSRKCFLEGMFDAGVISNTRLYLSQDAARYLKRNYNPKHLPSFSTVKDGDKSIIYVQMNGAHMVEGSHSCYLWLYKHLDSSVCVFNYDIVRPTYSQLTSGINNQMTRLSSGAEAKITHSPIGYSWQRKALTVLRGLGIKLTPKDVLSNEDYIDFKQRYGVREWS
ncbi:EH signature domain-containing protein [Vibrio parahaemolyticus]|uniref:EH signature domain-containing protein n=1 Tax=Vibrio parahaemolyticus TaxID=670 RepID=UPI00111ECB63|nr:EH signature domain-containing protein [Vibrio parahaemolyticus]MCZ6386947.1 EH signature domain-containing protein [Vibrio parahaemolyticus]MDF4862361.1 EH signature domain-containing protein [Vibrio parahaemolyticus]MRD97078.1 transcriptional regulator [Vibrio parahaemolyticus]QNE56902.1 transcriptional regulator [Vibrio parahaemolyticus]TNZ06918.1 transcriptional regulator [Vibrio parahaemolyticus]